MLRREREKERSVDNQDCFLCSWTSNWARARSRR